jgi:hypothetical protein
VIDRFLGGVGGVIDPALHFIAYIGHDYPTSYSK